MYCPRQCAKGLANHSLTILLFLQAIVDPEQNFLICALDTLSGVVEALGPRIEPLVSRSSVRDIVLQCCQVCLRMLRTSLCSARLQLRLFSRELLRCHGRRMCRTSYQMCGRARLLLLGIWLARVQRT